ncbi:hypothetical protein X801_08545, partial [Opisthorchis viverrini]
MFDGRIVTAVLLNVTRLKDFVRWKQTNEDEISLLTKLVELLTTSVSDLHYYCLKSAAALCLDWNVENLDA